MSGILAVLSPILVFGLVIFVHELGHFLAAKSVGVYTPRFSIGFGPALWRRRKGETEYILAAFPLGGYVRMASRHDEASAFLEGGSEESAKKAETDPNFDPEAMIPFGPKPVPENRWFESKPLWARLYILLAGVTMNILLGLVVAIGLALYYGQVIIPTRVVGSVRPLNGQPVLSQAIQAGDTIKRVNGDSVRTWSDAIGKIARSTDSVRLETNRGAVTVRLDQPGAPSSQDVALALDYQLPPILGGLLPGEPAAQGGMQVGDSIVSINGTPVRTWSEMVAIVASSADRPATFVVHRKGWNPATITVTPKGQAGIHPVTGERATVGKIGAYPSDVSGRERVSVGEAVSLGARTTWFMATSIVGTVRDLVTRRVSVDQLGGPIAITRASVDAARSGFESLFYLIALLSVNVAILNLLPIPILDGGQVLINILETARGRPFTLRTREYILRAGLMFILVLFVLVMFNDTRAIFTR
jgi:regulator of sigma E protease